MTPTGMSRGASIAEIGMPAASETKRWSGVNDGASSRTTPATSPGFTTRKIVVARATSAISSTTVTP